MVEAVALVTGAGGGLGSAISAALMDLGIAVVGTGRRIEPLQELQTKLAGRGDLAILSQDITAQDAPAQAVDFILSTFGRLDFLINNAGPGYPKTVLETTDEIADVFIDGHLKAPFRFARECYPVMSPGGGIVNITSVAGMRGRVGTGIYSAVKAGQIGLTVQLAAEFAGKQIRCNAVAPGVIATDMSAGRMDNVRFQRLMLETIPSDPPVGRPEDIGAAVGYLCSPGGRFVNGQVIVVDGGWTATHYLNDTALER